MKYDYEAYLKEQLPREEWEAIQRIGLKLNNISGIWPDYVNHKFRTIYDSWFFTEVVGDLEGKLVLDSCLGPSATTSITLSKLGARVISNEVDLDALPVARKIASSHGVNLDVRTQDWRDMEEMKREFPQGFDLITCLGNSLTYLFKREDQLAALRNFYALLADNGTFLIDTRNYPDILKGHFRFSGRSVYFGKDKVDVKPKYISRNAVVLNYRHKQTGEETDIVVYPFKHMELYDLLKGVGFRIEMGYSDYNPINMPCEFITYACRK
jgi:2-polyprenyl-3-methyl-5-hydroxy-6-metoxy-1,4-benzoquinol methylase